MSQRFALVTLCVVLSANAAAAQHLTLGVKGGVPLLDAFEKSGVIPRSSYTFDTKRYTVGPTGSFSLPLNLDFQVDALYTRLDYNSTIMGVDTFTRSATRANSWQFPFLVKKQFGESVTAPFGDIGYVLRPVSGTSNIVNTVFPSHITETTIAPAELVHIWTSGFAIGGGVAFRSGPLRFSPEIRYTRWAETNFRAANGTFQTNLNQVDFLLGIEWVRF
jgi:hypothetical protein